MPWTALWMVVASLAATEQSGGPLPLERDAYGRVSVEVGLGPGGPYRFLIDTGASLSSIAPRLADRLGLPEAGRVGATSVGDEAVLALVRSPVIRLGVRQLTVPWLVLLPASPSHPLARFDGILGQDVLRQFEYLIDVRRSKLWIGPSRRVLAAYQFNRFVSVSSAGPLAVVSRHRERWNIDSGASHVVLFGALPARSAGVSLVSTIGGRSMSWAGSGSLYLGEACVSWRSAVAVDAGARRERGLLPLWLFDAIYVEGRTGRASYVPARQRGDPDVAAGLGALEHNGCVAGRPGRVPDVPADRAESRELRDLTRRRRD
jgi:predicted aspartyl protease